MGPACVLAKLDPDRGGGILGFAALTAAPANEIGVEPGCFVPEFPTGRESVWYSAPISRSRAEVRPASWSRMIGPAELPNASAGRR